MKWKTEDIKEKIYDSVDRGLNQRFEQLVNVLKRRDEKEVFGILYSILLDESRNKLQRMHDQEIVGKLLWVVKPVCPTNYLQIVKSILKNYELSVEEIPLYFAKVLGHKSFLQILEQLSQEALSPTEQRSLNTFLFWLKCFSNKNDSQIFEYLRFPNGRKNIKI